LFESGPGAELYSETSDQSSDGLTMKRVEIAEGITVAVPRNFPRPVGLEDGAVKVLSFSLKPHEGASRFLHFFEIRASSEPLDTSSILAELGYEVVDSNSEEITLGGRASTLTETKIAFTLRCGTKENATYYAWTHYCTERKTHVLIATFTMLREGFLDIAKSFRCQ